MILLVILTERIFEIKNYIFFIIIKKIIQFFILFYKANISHLFFNFYLKVYKLLLSTNFVR